MVFSSLPFLFLYIPATLAVYFAVPARYRNLVLFIVSLLFYGWGEPLYILLMVLSITVNYAAGFLIEKCGQDKKRAASVVVVSVIINLSLLFFFKYYDFIVSNLSLIPGIQIKTLGLTLPIGISFYTFQAMSYPIDVYRGDAGVQKKYIHFGAFVTLFPQLIAGPIIRYKDVAEQLDSRRHSFEKFSSGAVRFTVGLCKKVLLANTIGELWDHTAELGLPSLSVLGALLGVLAFSFQIYFDFSGYSDMAVGLGRMLGFEFLENFNYPYISKSITEFWRRWHISLSTWFRDYVYITLGGNRAGRAKTYRNIFIVWMLTGIWHGASWNYLIWGVYFALLLMVEKAFLLKPLTKAPAFVGRLYTLVLVGISWAIFSIEDLPRLGGYIRLMFGFSGARLVNGDFLYNLRSYLPLLVILAVASTPAVKLLYERLSEKLRNYLTPALMLIGLLVSTAYLVDSTYNPFLYFRF